MTEAGRVDADAVVNAAGPWASAVNDMVDLNVPLRHTFGPILTVEGSPHDLPFALFESKYYFRSTDSRPISG